MFCSCILNFCSPNFAAGHLAGEGIRGCPRRVDPRLEDTDAHPLPESADHADLWHEHWPKDDDEDTVVAGREDAQDCRAPLSADSLRRANETHVR